MTLSTATERMIFRLAPVKTRKYVDEARSVFNSGDTALAEKMVVDVLRESPGNFFGYQLLGNILDKKGESELAAEAYHGQFPLKLVEHYLGSVAPFPQRTTVTDRKDVHAAEKYTLPQPGGLHSEVQWRFSQREIISQGTCVDTIIDGSAWDDGHNSMAFDSFGRLIDDYVTGPVPLIYDLTSRYVPQIAGDRVFLLSARGGGNYYHWMVDILPKLGVLQKAGYTFAETDRFVVSVFNKSFQKETLRHFGISEHQIFSTSDESPLFAARELVIPRMTNVMGLAMGKWLPEFVSNQLLNVDYIGRSKNIQNKRIFVSRDPAACNGRFINNISEVSDLFEEKGFEIVFPERLSLSEQAHYFSEADVIFAPHGAGLANILFCKAGATVVEFYGDHIAPCYWAICALKGINYYKEPCSSDLGVGLSGPDSARSLGERRSKSFSVDMARLEMLLDKVNGEKLAEAG